MGPDDDSPQESSSNDDYNLTDLITDEWGSENVEVFDLTI